MKIDLHMHSTASDGVLSPQHLVERVRAQGVECFSITDHDSLAAYTDWPSLGLQELVLMPGIEFSSCWSGVGIHLLGYGFDLDDPGLRALVTYQTERRGQRVIEIAQRLEKQGRGGALEWLQQQHAANDPAAVTDGRVYLGRPHFARFLIATGAVSNMQQAFKKYLGAGKAGDVKQDWTAPAQVVQTIRAAGGWAVLAHPAKYQLSNTKLRRLISEFAGWGGHAVEVVSGRQLAEQSRYLAQISQAAGLMASSGSDFHEPGRVWSDIGRQSPLPDNIPYLWQQTEWDGRCLRSA